MCLAIFKPAGLHVPENNLRNGFTTNSDGAGICWAVDGKLHVRKGIFDIEKFLEVYQQVKDYPCLIHFRKATHGEVNELNCHPFLFNDDKMALIHNGVLKIKCTVDGWSDTLHFVKQVVEPMVKLYNIPIDDGSLNYLICTSIGTDKMVIMKEDGKAYIFNEELGTWDDGSGTSEVKGRGVWYSNTYFRYCSQKSTGCSYSQSSSSSTDFHNGRGGLDKDYNNQHHYSGHNDTRGGKDTRQGKWSQFKRHSEELDTSYIEFWRNTTDPTVGIKENSPQIKALLEHSSTVIDVEEVGTGSDDSVDAAGNPVIKSAFSEGEMCEYGWWDEHTENRIAMIMESSKISREDALIKLFNEQ